MDEALGKTDSKTKRPMSTTGKVLLGVTGGVIAGICVVTVPFVMPALRRVCLPYVPATPQQVENVMLMLRGRSGSLVDLGSGDGRIVVEAARRHFDATGIELNPWLVLYSRFDALRRGVSKQTRFHRRDIWKTDFSLYDNIVIFGVDQMMAQLEDKLELELRPGSHVVACRFPLPSWKPVSTVEDGVDSVWLYQKRDMTQHSRSVSNQGKEPC